MRVIEVVGRKAIARRLMSTRPTGRRWCSGTIARVNQGVATVRSRWHTRPAFRQELVVQLARLNEGLMVRVAVDVLVGIALVRVQIGGACHVVQARVVGCVQVTGLEVLGPILAWRTITFPSMTPDVAMDVLMLVARVREKHFI